MRKWPAIALGGVIVASCVAYGALLAWRTGWAEFGDAFGALNTLFSGLAFAGLIVAIWLQHGELALTREEVAGQREQLEKHTASFKEQRFNAG